MERGSVGATLAVARGQGGRIATASVRTGFAMTGFLQEVRWDGGTHGSRPTIVLFVGQGPRALPWVRQLSGGAEPRPLRIMGMFYRYGGILGSGCGPDRVKMAPFKAISGVPSVVRICRVRVS